MDLKMGECSSPKLANQFRLFSKQFKLGITRARHPIEKGNSDGRIIILL